MQGVGLGPDPRGINTILAELQKVNGRLDSLEQRVTGFELRRSSSPSRVEFDETTMGLAAVKEEVVKMRHDLAARAQEGRDAAREREEQDRRQTTKLGMIIGAVITVVQLVAQAVGPRFNAPQQPPIIVQPVPEVHS